MVSRARFGELLRFGLLTMVSAGITIGLPVLLHEGLGIDPRIAVAIAFALVFVFNFTMMRLLVFRDRGNAMAALRRFFVSSLVFRSAEYVGFLVLYHMGMRYYAAQIVVVGVSFGLKFLTMRHIVFKPSLADPLP